MKLYLKKIYNFWNKFWGLGFKGFYKPLTVFSGIDFFVGEGGWVLILKGILHFITWLGSALYPNGKIVEKSLPSSHPGYLSLDLPGWVWFDNERNFHTTKVWSYVLHAAISMKQRCQYFITLNLQNKAQPISHQPSLQTSVCLLNKVSFWGSAPDKMCKECWVKEEL